jgi:hypothetical protein
MAFFPTAGVNSRDAVFPVFQTMSDGNALVSLPLDMAIILRV